MTTIVEARAALATAVGASDEFTDPPARYIYSQGSDIEILGRGASGTTGIRWVFRVSVVSSLNGDDATSSRTLAALLQTTLGVLWPLAGWSVDRVSADLVTEIAGGRYYSADIDVSTVVHI
jgi:hypothetical protein